MPEGNDHQELVTRMSDNDPVQGEIPVETFPEFMGLLEDVFRFEMPEIRSIVSSFSTIAELTESLSILAAFIENAEIDPDLKEEAMTLIGQEQEMISFSEVSRNGVTTL